MTTPTETTDPVSDKENTMSNEQLTHDENVLFDVVDCFDTAEDAQDFIRRLHNAGMVIRRKGATTDPAMEGE
jgi:hypothetical protein